MAFAEFQQRKLQRLKWYDYSNPGHYFVTVCTKSPEYFFGKVVNKKMKINDAGKMISELLVNLHKVFQNIKLDQFVVMPNHIHAIINILDVITFISFLIATIFSILL